MPKKNSKGQFDHYKKWTTNQGYTFLAKDKEDALDYLSKMSADIGDVKSLKEASSRLLETQMQKLMLASATDDYVFKVIESPLVPEEESGPNRILNVIFGLVVGSVMAFLVIILRNYRSLLGSKGS